MCDVRSGHAFSTLNHECFMISADVMQIALFVSSCPSAILCVRASGVQSAEVIRQVMNKQLTSVSTYSLQVHQLLTSSNTCQSAPS